MTIKRTGPPPFPDLIDWESIAEQREEKYQHCRSVVRRLIALIVVLGGVLCAFVLRPWQVW